MNRNPTAPVGADYISARAGIATAYPGAYTMRPYTHDPGFAVWAAFMAARKGSPVKGSWQPKAD